MKLLLKADSYNSRQPVAKPAAAAASITSQRSSASIMDTLASGCLAHMCTCGLGNPTQNKHAMAELQCHGERQLTSQAF